MFSDTSSDPEAQYEDWASHEPFDENYQEPERPNLIAIDSQLLNERRKRAKSKP